jgi:hypothetical protein
MERRPKRRERWVRSRVRRRAKEIALALLLTIAAAAFITAALLRGNGAPDGAPPFETARKPPTRN